MKFLVINPHIPVYRIKRSEWSQRWAVASRYAADNATAVSPHVKALLPLYREAHESGNRQGVDRPRVLM